MRIITGGDGVHFEFANAAVLTRMRQRDDVEPEMGKCEGENRFFFFRSSNYKYINRS